MVSACLDNQLPSLWGTPTTWLLNVYKIVAEVGGPASPTDPTNARCLGYQKQPQWVTFRTIWNQGIHDNLIDQHSFPTTSSCQLTPSTVRVIIKSSTILTGHPDRLNIKDLIFQFLKIHLSSIVF